MEKELLVGLLIVLVAALVFVYGAFSIYGKEKVSQEGLLNCATVGGECIPKANSCSGEVHKSATGCGSNQTCCITKESFVESIT